ncbi:hypothetical protein [Pontivivens insulae]|uniref:DUF2158 domain-containing protein n=1 Tax=Pontivivens insulae TaxID=1639689 RepID=A0A2R8AD68_9RHOB|nr:hypothetical protein [Pontivivens insulae]RED14119.1 hypothetical protein DFR53_1473 [Pontivivens insulae]SPF30193.1 hypothetical protein POI8812_02528 [Pontivivens insulae]
MADFNIGDIVVLTAGSMRMAVEGVDGDMVSTVWCNEGVIGRDTFASVLLKKWEHRENDRGGDRGGFKGGDRGGKGGGFNKGGDRGGFKGRDDRDDRPRGKPGWDGKPRENKFFRKD